METEHRSYSRRRHLQCLAAHRAFSKYCSSNGCFFRRPYSLPVFAFSQSRIATVFSPCFIFFSVIFVLFHPMCYLLTLLFCLPPIDSRKSDPGSHWYEADPPLSSRLRTVHTLGGIFIAGRLRPLVPSSTRIFESRLPPLLLISQQGPSANDSALNGFCK